MWLVHDFPLINDDYAREFLRKLNITRVVADDDIIALWRMQTTKECAGLGDRVQEPGVELQHEICDRTLDDIRLITRDAAPKIIPIDTSHNYAIIDLPDFALDANLRDRSNVYFVFCGRQPPYPSVEENDDDDDAREFRCGRQCDQVWFDWTFATPAFLSYANVAVDLRSHMDVVNWRKLLTVLQREPKNLLISVINGASASTLELKRFAAFYMQVKRWLNSMGNDCAWTGNVGDKRVNLFDEQLNFRKNGCVNSNAFIQTINATAIEMCAGGDFTESSNKPRDICEPYLGFLLLDVPATNRFQSGYVCLNAYKNGAPVFVKSAV